MIDHYQAVLRDLEQRRDRCRAELADIERTIDGIKKLLSNQASLLVSAPRHMTPPPGYKLTPPPEMTPPPGLRFAGMSVRWAILKLLSENTGAPMKTGEIAQALIDGGISSKGQSFNSNVSAVLSDMKNKRSEVTGPTAGAWELTMTGRDAWTAIKATPQYRNRMSASQTTLQ